MTWDYYFSTEVEVMVNWSIGGSLGEHENCGCSSTVLDHLIDFSIQSEPRYRHQLGVRHLQFSSARDRLQL